MPWLPNRPYDELPHVPRNQLETVAVLRACIQARASLSELKKAVELIPNAGMLINTVPLLEAKASSAIENVVTTADALFRHLGSGASADAATKEALRYREAVLEGHRSLSERPLSTSTAELVCTRLKGVAMQVRQTPGTALRNASTGEVVYAPPEGEERLRVLLADWERLLHDPGEIDPLIRMAAAHYQFEAIHPFTDGNGRTGRALNTLFLVDQGLLPEPILYLSRYLIEHRDEYYRLLLNVTRDQAWEPWILYVLRGVEETALWTTAKIDGITSLARATSSHVRRFLPKIHSGELIDVLFSQPYCRIGNVVQAGIVGRQAASRYLKSLVSIGVLREESVGREKLFLNTRLLTMLTHDSNDFDAFPVSAPHELPGGREN